MEQPLSPDVEKLLQQLQRNRFFDLRKGTAKKLGKLGVSDLRVVNALITTMESDPAPLVRREAAEALRAPAHQEILQQHPDLMKKVLEMQAAQQSRSATAKQAEEANGQVIGCYWPVIFTLGVWLIFMLVVLFGVSLFDPESELLPNKASAQATRIILLTAPTLLSSLLLGMGLYFFGVIRGKHQGWWIPGIFILLLIPNIVLVNWQFDKAVRSRATSIEYWHTSPERLFVNTVRCVRTKDKNPCQAVYRCDSYSCNCDDDGCHTCYHQCPYAAFELQHVEEYATGDTRIIRGNQLPEDPQGHRYRSSEPIPQSVIAEVGVGAPPLWLQYKEQAEQGIFRPVTLEKQYLNWFVALSERDAYLGSVDSEWVQRFANRIPDLKRSPNSDDSIDFIYTVAYEMSPNERGEWVYWLNNMLPAAGMELQASVRVVLVEDADALEHPGEFATAVQIDWSSQKHGENLLPKNSAVFVLFVEPGGGQIAKARVFTGMPIGNVGLQTVENLEPILVSQPLEPERLMGGITTKRGDGKIYYRISDNPGTITSLLWGLDNPNTKFVRVSMEDNFGNLRKLAKPSLEQSSLIVLFIFLLNLMAAAGVAVAWVVFRNYA